MALPATDAFTGATGTQLTAYSSNWSLVKGDFDIQANQVCCEGAVTSITIAARWNADTFGNAQYAQLVVDSNAASAYNCLGPAVRCASAAESCYSYIITGTAGDGSYLEKLVAGTETQLGFDGTTPSGPVTLRLEASGTTLTAKRDGTTDLGGSITDNALSSGSAGIGGWVNNATYRTNTTGDSWEGGDIGSTPAYQPRPPAAIDSMFMY